MNIFDYTVSIAMRPGLCVCIKIKCLKVSSVSEGGGGGCLGNW